MKNIFSIVFFVASIFHCSAQTLDISEDMGTDTPDGAYYQDKHNYLNPFEGTYLYSDGHISIKFILQKKVRARVANGRYYEDLIIGGFQTVRDGVETANTLDMLETSLDNAWKYSIKGNMLMTGPGRGCDDCAATENRVRLGLVHSPSKNFAELLVRGVSVNGKKGISVIVTWLNRPRSGEEERAVPIAGGEYLMVVE